MAATARICGGPAGPQAVSSDQLRRFHGARFKGHRHCDSDHLLYASLHCKAYGLSLVFGGVYVTLQAHRKHATRAHVPQGKGKELWCTLFRK